MGEAVLSSEKDFTSFSYGGKVIRFRTSPRLRGYRSVKLWDHGYIEVIADYEGIGEIEEYIDLLPILKNLHMDADKFLQPITKVSVKND